jgi:hypothetical protein
MIDTRRSKFAARSLALAERVPLTTSLDPNEYANTRRRALLRQTRETVERAVRSERTTDAGRPK